METKRLRAELSRVDMKRHTFDQAIAHFAKMAK